jgi:hypothetical protein
MLGQIILARQLTERGSSALETGAGSMGGGDKRLREVRAQCVVYGRA